MFELNLHAAFLADAPVSEEAPTPRTRYRDHTSEFLVDRFDGAQCLFARIEEVSASIVLPGEYTVESVPSGGWLFLPVDRALAVYWIPILPVGRQLDSNGHVVSEGIGAIEGFSAEPSGVRIKLSHAFQMLDVVAWRLLSADLVVELRSMSTLERQAQYLWGSHTTYERPADLYQHVVHGHIYENRCSWPFYWRICSENDAHALYVVLTGLYRGSQKRIYSILRDQIACSTADRLCDDGAFRHGEWSRNMECHYRLHASGIHLMLDYLAEHDEPVVADALQRAARFLAARPDKTDLGQWFLHDELEQSEAGMRQSPFTWKASRVLGKSPTNMLVLNTHLDTLVGLDRYRRQQGDETLDGLIESAHQAAIRVLALRPAEGLYRIVAKLLYLTFLPPEKAARLPFLQRALKRVGWKWLAPRLHLLKTAFPRLVFPGGYIDRAVSLKGVADEYQTINLMDLLRFARRFPSPDIDALAHEAIAFTHGSGLIDRWAGGKRNKAYALGFWAESLWHACLLYPDSRYRNWLGECVVRLESLKLGLPPSLLGANAEAVPPDQQVPCPIVTDGRLRVANLSHGAHREFVLANASKEPVTLAWVTPPDCPIEWITPDGQPTDAGTVPAGGWLVGRSC